MKLILSRKGTDSSAGGLPSPIFPDGRILSLPIPQSDSTTKYSSLRFGNKTLSSLIKQLGGKQWRSGCHLDPDIDPALCPERADWTAAFGQTGSAQRHLEQEGVGIEDLFLFFGWFRQVEKIKGRWQFVKDAPDIHLIYGWMQVGEIIKPSEQILGTWPALASHPHMQKDYPFNTLYLPTETLSLKGTALKTPGAGVFSHYDIKRQLTMAGENRTLWTLPECFYPERFEKALSYHRQPWRWQQPADGSARLQAAARGQEFVLNLEVQPGVDDWINGLFC